MGFSYLSVLSCSLGNQGMPFSVSLIMLCIGNNEVSISVSLNAISNQEGQFL